MLIDANHIYIMTTSFGDVDLFNQYFPNNVYLLEIDKPPPTEIDRDTKIILISTQSPSDYKYIQDYRDIYADYNMWCLTPFWGNLHDDETTFTLWCQSYHYHIANTLLKLISIQSLSQSPKIRISIPPPIRLNILDILKLRKSYLSYLDYVYLQVLANSQITHGFIEKWWWQEHFFRMMVYTSIGTFLLQQQQSSILSTITVIFDNGNCSIITTGVSYE